MQNIAEIKISYKPKFKMNELPQVSSSQDAYEILSQDWEDISYKESVKIILLNRANRVLGVSIISTGGISGSVVDSKVVFQTALKANASSVILVHNHPSGNLHPSQADRELTEKIKAAGKFLDIPMLDHLVLTDSSFYSFADEGQM
jgi:DNA repair protein RadC